MGLLDDLNLTPRQRAASVYIPSLISAGYSGNLIQQTLSSYGMGIQRSKLLQIVSAFRNIATAGDYVLTLGRNQLPDISRLGTSIYPLTRNFAYQVKISGTGILTGENITRFITVSSDKPLLPSEAEALAQDYMDQDAENCGIAARQVQVVNILKSSELAL